jgi:hypothetical protein
MPEGNLTHSNGEHIVDVGFEGHAFVLTPWFPAVPKAGRLEGIVDDLQGVGRRFSEGRV